MYNEYGRAKIDNMKIKYLYDEVNSELCSVTSKLESLSKTETVQEFIELSKKKQVLTDKSLELYKAMKYAEYDSCHHIFVCSKVEHDSCEGRAYRSYSCIKCGLDDSVSLQDPQHLPFDRKIMSDYLFSIYHNGASIHGIYTDIVCDIDLAKAMYLKIKEANPDIDDKTVIQYFNSALKNMKNIEVTKERQINRAKRLSLNNNLIK